MSFKNQAPEVEGCTFTIESSSSSLSSFSCSSPLSGEASRSQDAGSECTDEVTEEAVDKLGVDVGENVRNGFGIPIVSENRTGGRSWEDVSEEGSQRKVEASTDGWG